MSKSIRVNEKYGINSIISTCFFCGEEKQEAASNAIIDYEPCDKCKKKMKKGITLIEVTPEQPEDKRPPISKKAGGYDDNNEITIYPLGEWAVIKEETFKRVFDEVPENKRCFVDDEMMNLFISMDLLLNEKE